MSALAKSQANLPFSDPLEPRILPRGGWPFWTLNTRQSGGKLRQQPYRLSDLNFILGSVRKDLDTYMSQAFFAAPCRRAVHLAWLTHAYVDLDFYKLPQVPSAGEAGIMLRLFCRDEGIPDPSLIVFSGRGIYLKWCWSSPLPRAAAGRAVAVNKALVRRFTQWGADPTAVDVSRLLRVVGTTNSKSGERATVLWQAERDGGPLTYDFDLFADEVLPYSLEQVRDFRAANDKRQAEIRILSHERSRRRAQDAVDERRRGNARAFIPEDWHWGVLEDIRMLAAMRYNGSVPRGSAAGAVGVDLFGHLGACQLARVIPAGQLWPEIQAWARIILPAAYVQGDEFRRHCSTLLANAKCAAAGETVSYNGRQFTPIYTYRSGTMIDRLQITQDEMQQMTRLIDRGEKQRRDREATTRARRAAGVQPRSSYLASAAERGAEVHAMLTQLGSIKAVAERLGLSYDAVKKRLQRAPDRGDMCVPTSTIA
jgi:hypothetical protein